MSMMRGYGSINGYSRNSGCAGVCGRETFRWDNGPQGFGDGCKPGTSTQWSSSLAMAATFDPDLAYRWGQAMGEEFW
jgi:beta-glucosidase-like glycosyl hydrolase